MKKKIIFIILLLLININVFAKTCEYDSTVSNKKVNIKVFDSGSGISVQFKADDRNYTQGVPLITNELNNLDSCPSAVYFLFNTELNMFNVSTTTTFTGRDNVYVGSANLAGGTGHGGGGDGRSFDGSDDLTGGFSFGGGNCEAIKRFNEIIKKYINAPLKVVAILLLVGLTIVDFVKNIGDKDADPKKPFNNLIKRAIACGILFFAKEIVDIIIKLAGIAGGC